MWNKKAFVWYLGRGRPERHQQISWKWMPLKQSLFCKSYYWCWEALVFSLFPHLPSACGMLVHPLSPKTVHIKNKDSKPRTSGPSSLAWLRQYLLNIYYEHTDEWTGLSMRSSYFKIRKKDRAQLISKIEISVIIGTFAIRLYSYYWAPNLCQTFLSIVSIPYNVHIKLDVFKCIYWLIDIMYMVLSP